MPKFSSPSKFVRSDSGDQPQSVHKISRSYLKQFLRYLGNKITILFFKTDMTPERGKTWTRNKWTMLYENTVIKGQFNKENTGKFDT